MFACNSDSFPQRHYLCACLDRYALCILNHATFFFLAKITKKFAKNKHKNKKQKTKKKDAK